MAGYSYDDYLQRLTVQDLLKDAGYVRNRRDGLRYPSYVRLDEHGQRVRGDKFIVTQGGRRCFQPPVQKTFNVISFIKEHPDFFPEYTVGMNPDVLVNKVCCRLLNTPYEEKEAHIKAPDKELRPFDIGAYEIRSMEKGNRESALPFWAYFRHRGINLSTQMAFSASFVLASKESQDHKGVVFRNLSFPLTVPGGDGSVVGFEERGRASRLGGSPYKGKAAGSNASVGLWIASPDGVRLLDAQRVLLFESAYDAMAYFQLHRKEDPGLWKSVFVSTGGNPTRGQMEGLVRTAPGALFQVGFDNDEAGKKFVENFSDAARAVKPYSEAATAFKNTPGRIGLDHEKESALFKLPEEVKKQYFETEELVEDLRTGYFCQEDKEELSARIKEGFRTFNSMVDDCVFHMERILPADGFKDFNDELIAKEESAKRAVGCDLDGDGAVETEESNEEKHRMHR